VPIIRLYRIVFTLLFLTSFTFLKAAKRDTVVHFSGKVYQAIIDTDKKLTYKNAIFKLLKTPYELLKSKTADNTTVNCVLDGNVVFLKKVKSDGEFKFELLYGKKYKIELLKEGYCLSTILVDTRYVPKSLKKRGLKIETEVDVIKKEDGVDEFSFPMVKILFDNSSLSFKEDEEHNLFVYSELEKARIELKNNRELAKEVNRLSGEAKKQLYKDIELERAAAKREVDRIISEAKIRADSIEKRSELKGATPLTPLINYSVSNTANSDTNEVYSSEMILPSEMDMSEDLELGDKKSQVQSAKKMLELAKLKAITKMDSLLIIERESKILAAENEILQTEQKLKDVERTLMLQSAKAKEDKMFRNILIGGICLMLMLALILFGSIRRKKKDHQTILLQKIAVEEQKHIVDEKNREITDSISYAKRIQTAILPPPRLVKESLKESFILYKPKDIVAGDFYWIETVGDKVLFAAADCTGHGVPGAMVSVICNNALNRSVREYGLTDPGKILDKTREIVIQEFVKSDEDVKDGMDIALCSIEGTRLEYAGAHNPLWIVREDEVLETKANKQPIAKFDNMLPYTTHTFNLQKEDSIYIFSDGYVDQFGGEKGKKFKIKPFRSLLLSIQEKAMEEQKHIIDKAFESWRGREEQVDDVCVIGVRI